MYDIEYEHENNVNYMVVKTSDNTKEGYQIKMLIRNTIQYLLPLHIQNVNNKKEFLYNITSKQQMTKLYELNKIKWENLKNICISISGVVRAVNEYMLDLDSVLLDPEYMFVDMDTMKISFAYFPYEKHDFQRSVKTLFEYILEHYDHETDKMELMKVYEIYQLIVHNDYDPEKMDQLVGGMAVTDKVMQPEQSVQVDQSLQKGQSGNVVRTGQEIYSEPVLRNRDNGEDKNKLVIPAIPEEEIVDEKEEKVGCKTSLYQITYVLGIVGIIHSLISFFLPSRALIHTGLTLTVLLLVGGMFIVCFSKQKMKQSKMETKILHNKKTVPYEINNNEVNINNYECKGLCEDNELQEQTNTATLQDVMHYHNNEVTLNQDRNIDSINSFQNATSSMEGAALDDCMGQTMLLSDYLEKQKKNKKAQMYLIPQNQNASLDDATPAVIKKIEIAHFPCIIGTMEGYCDVILQNHLISRMHLCIRKKDDGLFIEDLNSTNGTFLNETRIKPNQQLLLASGDMIGLASAVYKVEIS